MSLEPSFIGGAPTPLPQPGSLEYINRPNPVEPSNLSHGSFDGSARELDRTTNEQLHPFLLGNRLRQRRDVAPDTARPLRHSTHQASNSSLAAVLNDDRPSPPLREHTPQRRDVDQTLFHLPKLPVKRGTKRHRVPPVLQGLHQPPPDAGLLPSISTEESQGFLSTSRSNKTATSSHLDKEATPIIINQDVENAAETTQDVSEKRTRRNRWTDQETEDLLQGVTKFGIGSWKKILLCPDYQFHKRTAVDLKDRFRVCRPDAYGGPRKTKKPKKNSSEDVAVAKPSDATESAVTEQPNEVHRAQTGLGGENLWKAQRRPRRNFTAEEDEALLKGFREQGASWVSILKNNVFREHDRTPTDLRDRFRTKFPNIYAEAGLASRPAVPKPARRTRATRQGSEKPAESTTATHPVNSEPRDLRSTHSNERLTQRTGSAYGIPLPSFGDDSLSNFGFPDDDDDADPIVLDRSIVDWANNNMPPSSRNNLSQMADSLAFPGIDPLVTLKLPKPGLF